jgi:cytochrome b subunit of formate dehydrogenase
MNAAAMTFTMAYHVLTMIIGTLIKIKDGTFDIRRTQIPMPKDAFDLIHDLKFFFGLEKTRPKMDKFMYKQKIHYIAAAGGNSIMVITGACFLFPDIVAKLLPVDQYYVQSFARLAHPHEAVLALLVIAFWHWYNVHLEPGRFPMQWTFLTGKIAREHQIEEHFLDYERELRNNPEEREYIEKVVEKYERELD